MNRASFWDGAGWTVSVCDTVCYNMRGTFPQSSLNDKDGRSHPT